MTEQVLSKTPSPGRMGTTPLSLWWNLHSLITWLQSVVGHNHPPGRKTQSAQCLTVLSKQTDFIQDGAATCRSEAKPNTSYTRRRLGGRQPLCGTGVTSRMLVILNPTLLSARNAASRPEPGPFTKTANDRTPCSRALSGRILCSKLCGKRRALSRPLESARPCGRPRYGVTLHISNGNNCVVKVAWM